ncbi:Uncharacterised protein [Bordetella pertussis]|nr:Uncharacterised protein [Bordetella pertussis]
MNITAATVETIRPSTTGPNSLRTSSSTGTRAKPATAISEDQATRVPPPVQIAPIWPTAARVAASTPTVAPSAPDKAPVSGRPEKPEPSIPVMTPTMSTPKATTRWLLGIQPCAACSRSNSRLGAWPGSTPRMPAAWSGAPRKKKPAMGSTEPMALNAKTKPSVTWSAAVLRKSRPGTPTAVAATISSAAAPPTRAAASPPRSAGSEGNSRGATMTSTTSRKTTGVTMANRRDQPCLPSGTEPLS